MIKNRKLWPILLLCLCAALLFGACKPKDQPPAPTPPVSPVSLAGYALVRPQITSERITNLASDLYERLLGLPGNDPAFSTDHLGDGETAPEKEILIGHTNRPETQIVLSQLTPGEYAVAVVGSKLVVTGFTDSFTPMAVEHLLSAYFGEGADGTVPGDLFHRGQADHVTLVDAGVVQYALVRAQYASDTAVDCMYRIADRIEQDSTKAVTVKTDSSAHDPAAAEILVGRTSYEEFNRLKDSCAPDSYGVYYVDNKIILFGWTDEDLVLATNAFLDNLKYSSYRNSDGGVSLSYPRENLVEANAAGYFSDVPMSAGGDYYDGVFNCSDRTMQLYWLDADEGLLAAYSQALEEMGYTVWQTNENNSVLAATYRREDTQVNIYYLKNLSEFRVSTQQNAAFPINPYEYEKICDVSVAQLGLDYTASQSMVGGMGYVILLEDGTFVIIDGGYGGNDSEILWDTLNSMKPAGVDEIVVSAWFLTHGHFDHYGTLQDFIRNYSDCLTVKYLIGNDPSDFLYSVSDQKSRPFNYSSVNGKFGGCVYLKAHTGQSFSLPGVNFNILFTQEDTSTVETFKLFNSTSMVFDAYTNDARFIWFGDIEREGALRIKSMYFEDLKCDVMQVAHHGVNGGSLELYQLCKPSVALYPVEEGLFRSYANIAQNKYILDTCEKILFAYEGTQFISFAVIPDYGQLEGAGEVENDSYSKFY